MKSLEFSQILILVPKGAEHQSVIRGLKSCPNLPQILPIPVGIDPVTRYLQEWWQKHDKNSLSFDAVILMGLGGSLSTKLGLGQAALIKSCLKLENDQLGTVNLSDRQLNTWIQQRLGNNVSLVQGITSDHVITKATEKQKLGQNLNCQVVDMEGWAVLDFFAEKQIPVSILRIISDEVNQSLPNLSQAYDPNGNLNAIALAIALLKHPVAAFNLIRGSLKALKQLELLISQLDRLA